jgi:hypothetical protein
MPLFTKNSPATSDASAEFMERNSLAVRVNCAPECTGISPTRGKVCDHLACGVCGQRAT